MTGDALTVQLSRLILRANVINAMYVGNVGVWRYLVRGANACAFSVKYLRIGNLKLVLSGSGCVDFNRIKQKLIRTMLQLCFVKTASLAYVLCFSVLMKASNRNLVGNKEKFSVKCQVDELHVVVYLINVSAACAWLS